LVSAVLNDVLEELVALAALESWPGVCASAAPAKARASADDPINDAYFMVRSSSWGCGMDACIVRVHDVPMPSAYPAQR
jgi:hypothetical protein